MAPLLAKTLLKATIRRQKNVLGTSSGAEGEQVPLEHSVQGPSPLPPAPRWGESMYICTVNCDSSDL